MRSLHDTGGDTILLENTRVDWEELESTRSGGHPGGTPLPSSPGGLQSMSMQPPATRVLRRKSNRAAAVGGVLIAAGALAIGAWVSTSEPPALRQHGNVVVESHPPGATVLM